MQCDVDPDLLEAVLRERPDVELARAKYPAGTPLDPEPGNLDERCARTRGAIESGSASVHDAVFVADGTFVIVDLLERLPEGFALVDVQSIYDMRPQDLPDVVVQVHVARAAGLDIRRVEIMHFGQGTGDPWANPARSDVTAAVEALLPEVPEQLRRMHEAIAGPLPVLQPERPCVSPFDCSFYLRCHPEDPESSI